MSNKKTIPRPDREFNSWQETMMNEVEERAIVWGLDAAWLNNELRPKAAKWRLAWERYDNPKTRTPVITGDKNAVRVDYEKSLSQLVGILKLNPLVTDSERRALGINIRDTMPTPVPVPTSFPVVAIDSSQRRCITIAFRDSETNLAAKPKGVHGAEIRWLIADEQPEIDELTNSDIDTRTPYTLEFTEAQRGKTIWICLRWQNTRGEKGKWGDIEKAIIP